MKTTIHFLSYLIQSFLEWEICQIRVVEEIKTHILCSITFLKNHAFYEIIWKNIVEPGRPQMTICYKHIACWITKATNTHSEYVILLFHRNSGCKYAPRYVIHTFPVVFNIVLFFMYRLLTIFVPMLSWFTVWLFIVFTQTYYVLYIPCHCTVRIDESEIPVCMYYVCVCVCVGGCACMCMHACVCACVCMHACVHVCTYVCMYVCMSCMRVCMHMCMYVCACAHACVYVYTEHEKILPNLTCSYKRWQGVTLFTSIIEWGAKLVLAMGYFCCFLLL
jgi:hypothetical protein